MNKWTIDFTEAKMIIECEKDPRVDFDAVKKISNAIEAFNTIVPVAKLTFKVKNPPELKEYEYKIEAVDTRVWSQTIDLMEPSDPPITFNVPDKWKFSEFSVQRFIRDRILELYREQNMTKLTWTRY